MAGSGKIRVTQTRSLIGRKPNHRACIRGLGLRRIGHSVVLNDTPAIRGMVKQVAYMLHMEESIND